MDVKEAIEKRRAYRSLEKVEIDKEIVNQLIDAARLAPSCFNKQPWKYVFVYDTETKGAIKEALSSGNEWAHDASAYIAVFSKKEEDCIIKEREYYFFDTGMATAHIILRATEMGLVAHPIAGFSPKKTREILGIPNEFTVLTLIIVGKKFDGIKQILNDHQKEAEKKRPERKDPSQWAFHNKYGG